MIVSCSVIRLYAWMHPEGVISVCLLFLPCVVCASPSYKAPHLYMTPADVCGVGMKMASQWNTARVTSAERKVPHTRMEDEADLQVGRVHILFIPRYHPPLPWGTSTTLYPSPSDLYTASVCS